MKTDNELDDLFKNTFSDHEAPIPTDMWQRIQPGGSKKRPVALWWKWYIAAAVFLIAGMATWWYIDTTRANTNKATSYSTSSNKENNQQTNQDTSVKSDSSGVALQGNSTSLNNQPVTTNKSNSSDEQQLTSLNSVNEKENRSRSSHLN